MAKKKVRKAPSRPCAQCGKGYHPRSLKCPHCGAASPKPARKKIRRKPGRKRSAPTAASATADPLDAAVSFINAVGGFANAKKALARIEQIKGL